MTSFENITSEAVVYQYNSTYGIFKGLLSEMRELSKKKPEATLSPNKVKLLNRVLDDLHAILKNEPEGKYLDPLDDDKLPQNSDAVLVMVQYEKALFAFEGRYKKRIDGQMRWITKEYIKETGYD